MAKSKPLKGSKRKYVKAKQKPEPKEAPPELSNEEQKFEDELAKDFAALPKRRLGRPSKYLKKYADLLLRYFNVDVVERIVDLTGKGGTNTHFNTVRVPSIEGFAGKIGVHKDTVYEWAKVRYPDDYSKESSRGQLKHPEFSDALARVQTIQEGMVFEYGMAGKLDRSLAAMYFTNKLGFIDKKNVEESGEKKVVVITRKYGAQDDNNAD